MSQVTIPQQQYRCDLFMDLFKGREDVYAKKWTSPDGKKGYSPACINRGTKGICKMPCKTCANSLYAKLTPQAMKEHLDGRIVIGCYPLREDNTVSFAALDFDDHKGDGEVDATSGLPVGVLSEVKRFVAVCDINGFPVYIERSQSGNGVHAWLFFETPIAAVKVRRVVRALIQEANPEEDMSTFDRMFPNQDKLSGKGLGNLIALPLQGPSKVREGKSAFLDRENGYKTYAYEDQWELLGSVEGISEERLETLIAAWDLTSKQPQPLQASAPKKSNTVKKSNITRDAKKLMACNFIRHCDENRETLTESLWFAMVSNVAVVDRPMVHALSEGYPAYSHDETEAKIEHVLGGSAPITCDKIREFGFDCSKECGVKSPAGLAFKKSTKSPQEITTAIETLVQPCDIDAMRGILRDIVDLSPLEKENALKKLASKSKQGIKVLKDEMAQFKRSSDTDLFEGLEKYVRVDHEVFFQQGNSYQKASISKDVLVNHKTLSNFALRPVMRIRLPQGEVLRADVLTDAGTLHDIDFPRDCWNSRNKLAEKLHSYDTALYGTDLDIPKMMQVATNCDIPAKQGTTVMGYHDGQWITPQGVFSKDGIENDPPIVYVHNDSTLENNVFYKAAGTASIGSICEGLLNINAPKTIIPVIGWYFSTPFASRIKERTHQFPLLFGWGTRGSGKTETMRLMQQLFGVDSEPYSCAKTSFTMLKLLSCTNGVPVFLDEYKPNDMSARQLDDLHRRMRSLYGGEVDEKGRADQGVNTYVLSAPTAIVGEQTINESAISERIVGVNFDRSIPRDSHYANAFKAIRTLDIDSFGYQYITHSLGVDIDAAFSAAEVTVDQIFGDRKMAPRIKHNLTTTIMGFQQFESFAKKYGVNFDGDIGFDGAIEALIEELDEEGNTKTAFDLFIEQLAIMASNKSLEPSVAYRINKNELYLHIPSCCNAFRKYAKECDLRIEVLDETAYTKQAQEIQKIGGYVKGVGSQKCYRSSGKNQKRSVVINLADAENKLDVSGFICAVE